MVQATRLHAIDIERLAGASSRSIGTWSAPELNGFDFNYRVLKPWQRDPAFYQTIWTDRSDVPAHEGTSHQRCWNSGPTICR